MLVFATSDKGGTGRSVTSSNLVYRRALSGSSVAYLDFDFGSPTAGSIFRFERFNRGTPHRDGLHSYLLGEATEPVRLDVWAKSDRVGLRGRPLGAGRLVLLPGDENGSEFPSSPEIVRRCVQLLMRMEEEYEITLVDLSAGRSYATDIVLEATATPQLRGVTSRWLVFHRWTRQHILAASGLVFDPKGIIDNGVSRGHDRARLAQSIRFVRTAMVSPAAEDLAGLRPQQVAWLHTVNLDLQRLATSKQIGRMATIGEIPLDPLLQWREQLITDTDTITRQIANRATVEAFDRLAKQLDDDEAWRGL